MAIATCVFTCNNWFSMSRTICFNIRSGSSAFSTRSFKFARSNVLTLSSNDIRSSFNPQLPLLALRGGQRSSKCILLLLCRLARRRIRRLLECRHVLHHFRGESLGSLCRPLHHQRHVLLGNLRLRVQ